jgi:putative membrane protein
VINALLLKLASLFTPGFKVHGFLSAVLGSVVLTVLSYILRRVLGL